MGLKSLIKRSATAAALAVSGWCATVDAAPVTHKPAVRDVSVPGRSKTSSQMIDIALDDKRVLRGRFVDSEGQPIDGAVVTLRQSDRVIARSTTLHDGTFEIERVPSGTYRLSCGSASGQIRCWTSDAAPPNAVIDGVTFQDNVVRGQAVVLAPALLGSSAMTTAAASGAAIGGVATFAAVDSGSSSHSTPTTAETSTPVVTQTQSPHQLVGRDAQGNLVRIRGTAPWNQNLHNGKVPSSDSDLIILPSHPGIEFNDQFQPASP
jgi:hypothetical protein